MTCCVTTFSKDGYELYGHKMISTWLKFWPKNFHLIIYHEGFEIEENDLRLKLINLQEACPNLLSFKKQSEMMLLNLSNRKERNRVLKTIKWSHKVYVMSHALASTDDQYLIFLDGDTYSISQVENNFPEVLVGDQLFAVHFERLKQGLHFETGLIIFNKNHAKIKWLQKTLTTAYDTLDIYNMNKTWDGYWLAHLYFTYRLPVKNLGSGVFSHPLVKKSLVHDVGVEKYRRAGYDEFLGRK